MSQRVNATPARQARSRSCWLPVAVCIILAAAVWAVFGQTRHYEFVNYDDDEYVYDNPAITHGLSWNGVVWAFTHCVNDNWHPLTVLSHMLDCQIYGLQPGGHHLTNVLLHAATVILLFLLLQKLTGAFWRSAFVAAVFAVHPLHVESVAWVSERKDVLSGLFFMLTLWAYARYAEQAKAKNLRAGGWYGLALGLFALGLMSKPMLVTLPFVLLLLDYWPLKRISGFQFPISGLKALLMEKIPFLGLVVADCVVTIWAQTGALQNLANAGYSARLGNAVASYVDYLGQMFYPAELAVFYPHPGSHLSFWQVAGSLLVLILISAGVLAKCRRHPFLLVGWLWYLGMLVPVIGLIQVGAQARADRYTYLPQIGLCVMLAWGVVALCGNWHHGRAVLRVGVVAVLAGLLVAARAQTAYWKNSISLWTHTLACTTGNDMAHNNLGTALDQQGKLAEASQQFELALQINPDFVLARVNLIEDFIEQGKCAEAIQNCQLVLQLQPDKKTAALAHNKIGYALSRQGRLEEAIEHYELASQLNPDSASLQTLVHVNWGNALFLHGKWAEAIGHYEQALQINPADADVERNIGLALVDLGKPAEALSHFQQALNLAKTQNKPVLVETISSEIKSAQLALKRR